MDRWSRIALVPLLVAGIVLLGSPPGTARAERLRTEVVLERTDAHAQLESVVSRSEVRARLAALGVRPEEARARIAALSDAEARAMAEEKALTIQRQLALNEYTGELRERYEDLPDVLAYLEGVERDIIDNVDAFRGSDDDEKAQPRSASPHQGTTSAPKAEATSPRLW